MNVARRERAALTDLLARVGPDEPTLCEGWSTHDLAAHLWSRENDPSALPGLGVKRLGWLSRARAEAAKSRFGFGELVERLRAPSLLARVLGPADTIEWFCHHEDVLRARTLGPDRSLPIEFEDALWGPVTGLATRLRLRAPTGLVLERSDDIGRAVRIRPGSRTLTVLGPPSELVLWASGRGRAARVELIGDKAASKAWAGFDLSL